MAPPLRRAIVVTDGRAGNENQALGLAEAIARRLGADGSRPALDIQLERLDVSRFAAAAPAAALHAAGRLVGDQALGVSGAFWDAVRRGEAAVSGSDLVVGAGRRSAPVVAALRRRGARAAQILDPQMWFAAFDLIVAPAHDRLRGDNVVATLGAVHRIDPAALAALPPDPRLAAPQPAAQEEAAPRIAVLIGGPSRSARFGEDDVECLAAALERLASDGAHLMATASRRTAGAARARLAAAAARRNGFFWDGAGENPYPSMLAAADAIIVTADSVNMSSEAAATGAPLFIAELPGLSSKLARFHAALAAHGRARPLADLADAPGGLPERLAAWRPAPLSDMDAVVDRTLALFGDAA